MTPNNQPFQRKPFIKRREKLHNTNEEIKAHTVRVTGDDIESKVCSISEALALAKEAGCDLVEIAPQANPPVCRIVEYQKFLYEKKKKDKENKKNAVKAELKEIKMTPNIGEHDINFKVKNAIGFLEDGDKVKLTVMFKGRGVIFKDQGEVVLLKFAQALSENGKVEQMPKLEGKNMSMFITPKKKS